MIPQPQLDPKVAQMADKLILDLHEDFLKRCKSILLKVREGDVSFMQSFIIGLMVRDLYTRNQKKYKAEEVMPRTKEELAKLFEAVGLQTEDIEKFMQRVVAGTI